MIQYTGNPYVDAGVAVLELRLQKPCTEFTENDLASQADWIKQEYRKKIWKSYLAVHFMNCAWVQPKISKEKEQAYIAKVLESYKTTPLDPSRACAFCRAPANTIVDRSHVPLLTAESCMIAGGQGQPGLPVCGYCIFAVHFYPFATLKVAPSEVSAKKYGKPLFWWAGNPRWILRLNRNFYNQVQTFLSVSSDDLPRLQWPATRLLCAAREVVDELEEHVVQELPSVGDIVGIHATNAGRGPSYDELRIPRELLEFWSEAGSFDLYREIELRAWGDAEPKPKKKTGSKAAGPEKEPSPAVREASRRNSLYEELGKAFREPDFREKAKSVAVRFFMPRSGKQVKPNTTALAELFLERVAGMEKVRLEAIRGIADALVQSRNVNWIVDRLMRSGKTLYDFLPTMRAIERRLSAEKKPLAWDQLLVALGLSDEDDATSRDSPLVYELILIRMFEQLGLAQPEVLSSIDAQDEVSQ